MFCFSVSNSCGYRNRYISISIDYKTKNTSCFLRKFRIIITIKRKNIILKITPKKISSLVLNNISNTRENVVSANFIIFDDIFPHPLSDWRNNEYLYYLKNIDKNYVYFLIAASNLVVLTSNH